MNFWSAVNIAQKIFSLVWNKEVEFRGDSSVKTFLLSVAKNIFSEHKRKKDKETMVRQVWISKQDIGTSSLQAQAESNNAEVIQSINRAMVHLSQMQRQAIELFYSMELTPRKAAQVANCTEKAFECRLARAYKKLRKIIHNSEI